MDKLEASKSISRPPAPSWTSIDALIRAVVGEAKTSSPADIEVRSERLLVDLPELPKVYVDPVRTIAVFEELVMNAQKAILGAGRTWGIIDVGARASSDSSYVEILFTNDGPAIPRSKWQDIFLGKRLGSKGVQDRNTGTGLWRSRVLLEAQGGSIDILTSSESQTTFIVRLPTHQPGTKRMA